VPPDLGGGLQWMGLTPDVMGDDVYGYAWAKDYTAADRAVAPVA
jgi:toluene monooxygenase system protein A